MGMDIEVVAKITYTVHLTDEDMVKVKKFLDENKDELPSFEDEENICYAVSKLYEMGEISLYDDGKATESYFSTEEFSWSEFEDKSPKEILEGVNCNESV